MKESELQFDIRACSGGHISMTRQESLAAFPMSAKQTDETWQRMLSKDLINVQRRTLIWQRDRMFSQLTVDYTLGCSHNSSDNSLNSGSSRFIFAKSLEEVPAGNMTVVPTGKLTEGLFELGICHIKSGAQHPGDEKLQ